MGVLSYGFWRSQLAGSPDIVGWKVLMNNYPVTVIGVAAPGFHGISVGEVPSLWIPAAMSAQAIPGFDSMLNRRVRWMQVLGRLKPFNRFGRSSARLTRHCRWPTSARWTSRSAGR